MKKLFLIIILLLFQTITFAEDTKIYINKLILNDYLEHTFFNKQIQKDYRIFKKKYNLHKIKFQKEKENITKKIKGSLLSNNYFLNQEIKELEKRYNNLYKKKSNLLIKIKKKEIKIIPNIKNKIKKKIIFEIEKKIKEADYIVYLGIDLSNFLIKYDNSGKGYLVVLKKNFGFINDGNDDIKQLKLEILNDIENIKSQKTIEDMKKQIIEYNKMGKKYGSLFQFISLETFLNNFSIGISYRGGQFGNITDKIGINLKYYNNIFYKDSDVIKKLEEKGLDKLWLIIPLKYNEAIGKMLTYNSPKSVFLYPAKRTLFLNIKFNGDDKYNLYFDKIIELYKKSYQTKNGKVIYKGRQKITLGEFEFLNKDYIKIQKEDA